jgi:hypothetical protein
MTTSMARWHVNERQTPSRRRDEEASANSRDPVLRSLRLLAHLPTPRMRLALGATARTRSRFDMATVNWDGPPGDRLDLVGTP